MKKQAINISSAEIKSSQKNTVGVFEMNDEFSIIRYAWCGGGGYKMLLRYYAGTMPIPRLLSRAHLIIMLPRQVIGETRHDQRGSNKGTK